MPLEETERTLGVLRVGVLDPDATLAPPLPDTQSPAPTRRSARLDMLRRRFRLAVIDPAPISAAQIRDGLKAAAAPFIVSRVVVWAATLWGARYLAAPPTRNYSALYPPPALAPFFHWDADAYGFIAQHGYQAGVQTVRAAFFPLYPLLIHLLGGGDWAMLIIPNVSFFAALSLLYVVATKRMDVDRARLTLWMVALGPAAMFFSYPYTESLFLLVTVVSFLFMESGQWVLAGAAGLAASLTRAPGIIVAAALGAEGALASRRKLALVALALPVSGLVIVSVVDAISIGDPLAFAHAQAAWVAPNRNLVHLIGLFAKAVLDGDPFRPEALGMPVLLVFAAGALWTLRRLPISYGVYALVQVLIAANQAVYLHSFYSLPRYLAVIFPCYFAFATWLAPRRGLQLTWLAISATIVALNSALYGAWWFIG